MSLNLGGTIGDVLDLFKGLFVGEAAKLVLLREDGATKAFDTDGGFPYTVAAPWNPEFSEKFGYTIFRVADTSAEFAAIARKATHVVVTDSLIPSLNNVIHSKLTGDNETAAPDADPTWRICGRPEGRKYISGSEV